jgi:Nucleoside 2-deoxyribosyltransferase like
MGTILVSPNSETVDGPSVFLAGPILGAPDWHSDAIGFLSLNESISIISPRQARDEAIPFPQDLFNTQIEWEQSYMMGAMRDGVILFWFAKPIHATEFYAQQSFFELGDILAQTQGESSVAVGIEDGFPNGEYLTATLHKKYLNLTVHKKLSDVCDHALRLIRTQYI